MKRLFPFIFFLAGLSVVTGVLLSRMSFLARSSMSLFRKKYGYYLFMKVWWQGALLCFAILLFLLAMQYLLSRSIQQGKGKWVHYSALVLALTGLYFTYNDFRTDIAHRWAGERLHLGFYLFWIGWASVSVFLLMAVKELQAKDAGNRDASVQ